MTAGTRLTHVVENLERGGLERVVVDLAGEQARRGMSVQVACVFGRGTLAAEAERAGVAVVACGKHSGIDLGALARLRSALRLHGTTVLHTHNAAAHYHAIAAAVGLGIGRVVNTRHGMGVQQARTRREWLFRRALAMTDVVATVCEAAREEVLALGLIAPAKLVAVPNGIRLDAFRPGDAADRAALVAELGLPAGTRLVGAVGRLNAAKDPLAMVEAFRRLHSRHPGTALAWVGDGPERAAFEGAVRQAGLGGRVLALGDRDDVPRLLRGFDLYAMSSRTEGYSLALLEACAAGLPIVTTAVGGNREIVAHGRTGLVVPAGDPAALAGALDQLLEDPARARAMGEAARAWVEAHGSLAAMADRYARLYGPGA